MTYRKTIDLFLYWIPFLNPTWLWLEDVCRISLNNTCVKRDMAFNLLAAHRKQYISLPGSKKLVNNRDPIWFCCTAGLLCKRFFFVEDECGFSNKKKQTAGIRQGCPLSPYLFVLLMHMSVIDSDVSFKLQRARVYCSDDTILIATNTTAANRILMEVENVSQQYGLRLNGSKCCFISMNGNDVVKFPDGQALNTVEETYLGHQITEGMDVRHEIQHKMVQTFRTWYKLTPFWTTVACPKSGGYKYMLLSFALNYGMVSEKSVINRTQLKRSM